MQESWNPTRDLLERIADALERLAPPPRAAAGFRHRRSVRLASRAAPRLQPVAQVNRVALPLLKGIDRARDTLMENTQRFARGLPANNALLWGARGMGKSSLVKAVHAAVAAGQPAGAPPLKLIEIHREDIETLPELMGLVRGRPERFILFCDDLSFDAGDTSYKSLKAALEGGIEGRPDNVVFYATSNRRHLLPRDMIENERSTAINPSEAVQEKVSLSDRFGLWLGFHNCSQDDYLAMVAGYVAHFRSARRRGGMAARGARMGDDARRPLRPRRLAVRAGSGGQKGRESWPRAAPGTRRNLQTCVMRGLDPGIHSASAGVAERPGLEWDRRGPARQ